MIPGTYDLTIYRDSPVSIPLAFTSVSTGEAVPLTGLSPFTAQVREAPGRTVLVELTVTDTDLAGGLLTLEAEAADTAGLGSICTAKWDLIDTNLTVWLTGDVTFKSRISIPST